MIVAKSEPQMPLSRVLTLTHSGVGSCGSGRPTRRVYRKMVTYKDLATVFQGSASRDNVGCFWYIGWLPLCVLISPDSPIEVFSCSRRFRRTTYEVFCTHVRLRDHGLISSTSIPAKSAMFRVAMAASRERAIAEI